MWHLWNYNIFLIINFCLIVYWCFVLFINMLIIQIVIFLLHIFINIIYDDNLIIYYTCKLNFISIIKTYYNYNQV
jgi:hypothetical protein